MKICLVGYGAIADRHMEALARIDDVVPWHLVGRRPEPTDAFADKWGFKNRGISLDEALRDEQLDCVVITSPNELHTPQAEQAVLAGKHVLLEIPMSLSLRDAAHITGLAEKHRRKLMVAHTMRTFSSLKEIRRRVDEGEFRIHHVSGLFGLPRRSNTTYHGNPRSWTDNLLWHFGAHMIDAVLWTTGHNSARLASCIRGPLHPTQGVLDLSLNMSLPGGELFTLAQSYNISRFQWRLTFIGEEDSLEFRENSLYDGQGNVLVEDEPITDLLEQDEGFIHSIRNNHDPLIPARDILPTMGLLQEARDQMDRQGSPAD
jgi:2-hydroxy-4-carboxymuconate semialdehyde hemiacetal dehydrogenase